MRTERVALGLTILNVVLLATFVAAGFRSAGPALAASPSPASPTPLQPGQEPILRARALEIVDERGTVRSRLDVAPDGEVVLRLADRSGTIRVKLGADERGSGLLLLDETTEPGLHFIARRSGTTDRPTTTSMTLRAGNQRQVLRP